MKEHERKSISATEWRAPSYERSRMSENLIFGDFSAM